MRHPSVSEALDAVHELRMAMPREEEAAGALDAMRRQALPKAERHRVVDAGGARAIREALRRLRQSQRVFEVALGAVEAVAGPVSSAASRIELRALAVEVLDAFDDSVFVRVEAPSMRTTRLMFDAVTHLLLDADVRLSIADEVRVITLCIGTFISCPPAKEPELLDSTCRVLGAILGRSPGPAAETVQSFVRLCGPHLAARVVRAGVEGDGIARCAGSACRVMECLSRSEGVDAVAMDVAEEQPIARWVLALASKIARAAEAAEQQRRRLGGHLALRSAVATASNLVVHGGAGRKRVALDRGRFVLARRPPPEDRLCASSPGP
eukprot:m51a1_g570 hypothetical protein (324) ;mRNA; f:521348-523725